MSSLKKTHEELLKKLNEYKSNLDQIIKKVKQWNWNDPVSLVYRDIFDPSIIVDIEFNEKELSTEIHYRSINKIPPGLKDINKDSNPYGDIIIWKTILKIGRDLKRDLIFVSYDEKSDWQVRSENTALSVRFELVNEYYNASEGRAFTIVRLSELIGLFSDSSEIVHDIAKAEFISASKATDEMPISSQMLDEFFSNIEYQLSREFNLQSHFRLDRATSLFRVDDVIYECTIFANADLGEILKHFELSAIRAVSDGKELGIPIAINIIHSKNVQLLNSMSMESINEIASVSQPFALLVCSGDQVGNLREEASFYRSVNRGVVGSFRNFFLPF